MKNVLLIGLFTILIGIGGIIFIQSYNPSDSAENESVSNYSENENTNLNRTQTEGDTLEVAGENTMTSTQPEMQIDKNKSYTALLKTDKGDIEIELNSAATPITVNNFVSLARKNFYDKTVFHRVIEGFMIQGGDPEGTGAGGPGYRFDDEPFEGEYTRGTLAMANAGPDTNGSQFFIMHQDNPLPKNYVIFGKVIKGIEVVDAIATAPVKPGMMGENSTPVTPVVVKEVEIIEK